MSSTVALLSINSTLISNITNISDATVDAYDYEGAAIYVAVILIWYSTGLALMLFLQVNTQSSQSHFLVDSHMRNEYKSHSSNPFSNYHNVEADSIKKHILNELRDPERRQRLWKIYYASREKENEPHPRYYQTITADSATIGRINRKLADIHRIDAQYRDNSVASSLDASSDINRLDIAKASNKRLISFRNMNTVMTKNHGTLMSIPSQPDEQKPKVHENTESILNENQPSGPSSSGSRRRNKKPFTNRFTVEKVPEHPADSSTEAEHGSK